MIQISCFIYTVVVIFCYCISYADPGSVFKKVANFQLEVSNVVINELKSPDIETLDLVLNLLKHETSKGETRKTVSMPHEGGTENEKKEALDKNNQSVVDKDGRSGILDELSDVIARESLTNEVKEDEEVFLGFSEKERHDGYKRSSPKEYPYAVLVYTAGLSDPGQCSGTLITPSWVLTAAHCFTDTKRVVVYAGGNSLQELLKYLYNKTLLDSAQVRETNIFHTHPRYTEDSDVQFDIAVVKVKKNFSMTATVSTVSLYRRRWGSDSYKPCVLTGFGRVFLEKEDPEDETRKTHYLEVRRGCPCYSDPLVEDNMMCSRPREDYGVCSGDSGGGLICRGRVVAVAKAIVTVTDVDTCNLTETKTYECGLKNTLSIFQDIDPYLSWIDSKINNARPCVPLCPLVVVGVLFLVLCMN